MNFVRTNYPNSGCLSNSINNKWLRSKEFESIKSYILLNNYEYSLVRSLLKGIQNPTLKKSGKKSVL